MTEKFDIHLPVLVAPYARSSFLDDYKVFGVPSYCVINEQGIVQATGNPPQGKAMEKLVESWIRGKGIPSSQENHRTTSPYPKSALPT